MSARFPIAAWVAVLSLACAVASAQGVHPNVATPEQALTRTARVEYLNALSLPPATDNGSAVEIFGGHVGEYAIPSSGNTPVVPASQSYQLGESAFGQPFSTGIPRLSYVEDALAQADELLYYHAPGDEDAAFRFLAMLYASDEVAADPQERVRARFEDFNTLYGAAERDRADQAEVLLRDALRYDPDNHDLRNAFLDVLYHRAQAEMILTHLERSNADRLRLETYAPGVSILDQEIAAYEALQSSLDGVSQGYRELFVDHMGVDMAEVDPDAPAGIPFGLHMFIEESAGRSQMPAQYIGEGGALTPVLASGVPLYEGHRDVALLFENLSDRAANATELAMRHDLRDDPSDADQGQDLVESILQDITPSGLLLQSVIDESGAPIDPDSGLEEAIGAWRSGVSSLERWAVLLRGEDNPLGFSPDFLMLAENPDNSTFDSFDAFDIYIDERATSPLPLAMTLLQEARDANDAFRGNEDDFALQHQRLFSARDNTLYDVVGVRYGEPGFDDPLNNFGSDIYIQNQSVEAARLAIQRNTQEIANLRQRIQNELDRRTAEARVNARMRNVYIRYGNEFASLEEELADIEAEQAAADSAAAALSGFDFSDPGAFVGGLIGMVANGVNAGLQYSYEQDKGELEARRARLGAQQEAAIVGLEDELLSIESAARIKDLWLEMSTRLIESQEAALLLLQEQARLQALVDQAGDAVAQIQREADFLASRYFADPIHQIRFLDAAVDAERAFEVAQLWAYLMVRALEFKYNTPFATATWETDDVFRVRNAEELSEFITAVRNFDGLLGLGLNRDDRFDWFSVREDFFHLNDGELYRTEEGDLVEGRELFRQRLSDQTQSFNGGQDVLIVINFDTVRDIPGGSFFEGPAFDENGDIILNQRGTYLDKIVWLKISIPGSHTVSNTTLEGTLEYGGTALVRNQQVGTFDPSDPSLLLNEFTTWSTRHFFPIPDAGTADGVNWLSRDTLSAPITMQLAATPEAPPTVSENTAFQERSVAATDWTLTVPLRENGVDILRLEEIDDIELYFYHLVVVRP